MATPAELTEIVPSFGLVCGATLAVKLHRNLYESRDAEGTLDRVTNRRIASHGRLKLYLYWDYRRW